MLGIYILSNNLWMSSSWSVALLGHNGLLWMISGEVIAKVSHFWSLVNFRSGKLGSTKLENMGGCRRTIEGRDAIVFS